MVSTTFTFSLLGVLISLFSSKISKRERLGAPHCCPNQRYAELIWKGRINSIAHLLSHNDNGGFARPYRWSARHPHCGGYIKGVKHNLKNNKGEQNQNCRREVEYTCGSGTQVKDTSTAFSKERIGTDVPWTSYTSSTCAPFPLWG